MYVNPILVGVLGTLIVETVLMTIFIMVSVKKGNNKDEDNNDTSNE